MKKEKSKKNSTKPKIAESVSIVSHQLKTPLSAIKGYLEVLISGDLGKLNEEQSEYLKSVLENTDRMISLVKDILDVARIEADRMELNLQPTDLVEMVKNIVKDFYLLARAHNCELSFEISGEIRSINIDSIKIKEVISNLISNAIHYNKMKGKVEVSLFKKEKKVVFCCKDTGIGITEEEKDKIFTKFYRSEQTITISPVGSGLGLFISKAIVEKSGGKMWFKSKKGKGSVFCFSLPL